MNTVCQQRLLKENEELRFCGKQQAASDNLGPGWVGGGEPPSILHYCRRSSHTVLRRQRGMLPSTLHVIYLIEVAQPLQNLVYAMDSDRLTVTLLSEVMLLIS